MKEKKWFKKGFIGCINALALMLVIQTANSACVWVVHQPAFPEEAKKFQNNNIWYYDTVNGHEQGDRYKHC